MASTNKTSNLNLSQFIDTDKPSWLTDYNNDMTSIDESVGALKETAETLTSDVNAARAEMTSAGISAYTHSKEGTVHALAGAGSNIKFVATAGYAAGDTFVVNGTACEAKMMSGEVLSNGYFVTGAAVNCFYNAGVLTFGASTSKAEMAKYLDSWQKFTVSHTAFGSPHNEFYWNAETKELWFNLYSSTNGVTNSQTITTLPAGIPRPTEATAFLGVGGGYLNQNLTAANMQSADVNVNIYPDGTLRLIQPVHVVMYRLSLFAKIKLWYAMDGDRMK